MHIKSLYYTRIKFKKTKASNWLRYSDKGLSQGKAISVYVSGHIQQPQQSW